MKDKWAEFLLIMGIGTALGAGLAVVLMVLAR